MHMPFLSCVAWIMPSLPRQTPDSSAIAAFALVDFEPAQVDADRDRLETGALQGFAHGLAAPRSARARRRPDGDETPLRQRSRRAACGAHHVQDPTSPRRGRLVGRLAGLLPQERGELVGLA